MRKLPARISDLPDVAALLSKAFSISTDDIVVSSLAETSDRWENPPSKVVTLQLKTRPQCLGDAKKPIDNSEWSIPVPGGQPNEVMLLDTHFRGMTVLCSPPSDKHHTE